MDERQAEELHITPLSQSYPWLVIFDRANDIRQAFYSISRNRYYVRRIPELQNKYIVSCQQGWLFLEDNATGDCSLFNIFNGENLQLPPPYFDDLDNFQNYVMSSCTKIDDSCRIFVFSGNRFKYRSCNLGDSEFVTQRLSCDSDDHIGAVLNYAGKLYALTFCSYDLSVADIADPELHFTLIFRGHKSLSQMLKLTDDTKYYLIESSGEILLVYTNRFYKDGLDIKIYKADFERKEWVVVKCLGDRALFLDYYKGLSTSKASEFGLRGNCVYYLNSTGDGYLYRYDLKGGRITMTLTCPIISNEYSSMYWAM